MAGSLLLLYLRVHVCYVWPPRRCVTTKIISVALPISPCLRLALPEYVCSYEYRNRNPKMSKALLKSQAHQSSSLFTSAATNQRGCSKGGQEKLRSDFQNTRRGQSSC